MNIPRSTAEHGVRKQSPEPWNLGFWPLLFHDSYIVLILLVNFMAVNCVKLYLTYFNWLEIMR